MPADQAGKIESGKFQVHMNDTFYLAVGRQVDDTFPATAGRHLQFYIKNCRFFKFLPKLSVYKSYFCNWKSIT